VQAGELIRSVKIAYREADETTDQDSVRAWHAVRGTREFVPADKVAADPTLSAIVLAEMQREWKTLHRRYGHMAEFVDLVRNSVEAAA